MIQDQGDHSKLEEKMSISIVSALNRLKVVLARGSNPLLLTLPLHVCSGILKHYGVLIKELRHALRLGSKLGMFLPGLSFVKRSS